jgi:hypothetical protein
MGLRRQENGEMEADQSGSVTLNALNGHKSEILDIFLPLSALSPPIAPVASRTWRNPIFAAILDRNVRDPEPVARKHVVIGRGKTPAGSNRREVAVRHAAGGWTRSRISAQ